MPPPTPILDAWLYAVTRRTAIDAIRKESRRQLREQIAVEMNNMNATSNDWTQIEPLLDDAMAALDETDRSAILLRYFENKSLREVGEALGHVRRRRAKARQPRRGTPARIFLETQRDDWRERTGRFDFRQRRSSRASGVERYDFNRGRLCRHHYRNAA